MNAVFQSEQKKEVCNLLSALGYDLSKEEGKVFADVVEDTLSYMGKEDKETIQKLVYDKRTSPIYVDLAYFDYERGLGFIHNSLAQTQQNREKTKDKVLASQVFEDEDELDPYSSVLYIASYLNQKAENTKAVQKTKTRKCKVR